MLRVCSTVCSVLALVELASATDLIMVALAPTSAACALAQAVTVEDRESARPLWWATHVAEALPSLL